MPIPIEASMILLRGIAFRELREVLNVACMVQCDVMMCDQMIILCTHLHLRLSPCTSYSTHHIHFNEVDAQVHRVLFAENPVEGGRVTCLIARDGFFREATGTASAEVFRQRGLLGVTDGR